MKKLLLICICIAFAFISNAQTNENKWNIGLSGGASQYKGDLGNDFYKTNTGFFSFWGVSVSRYLGKHFDITLLGTKGLIGSDHDTASFRSNLNTITLNLKYNILSPYAKVRPYVFVGTGAMLFYYDKRTMFYWNHRTIYSNWNYAIPSFGAGLNYNLNPSIVLNLQEMFMYSSASDKDGIIGKSNDDYVYHSIGLSYNFGKKKDADNDGVADHADRCPNTPLGMPVNKKGCPINKNSPFSVDYKEVTKSKLFPAIQKYYTEISTTPAKNVYDSSLTNLSIFIKKSNYSNKTNKIVFACPDNSFRSVAAQIILQSLLADNKIKKLKVFSCGYQPAEVDLQLITILKRHGFNVVENGIAHNNRNSYKVSFGDNLPPLIVYAKSSGDSTIPVNNFFLMKLCDSSETICNNLPGATTIYNMPFANLDDLDLEARDREFTAIATEILYAFNTARL